MEPLPDGPLSFPYFPPALGLFPPAAGGGVEVSVDRTQKPYLERGDTRNDAARQQRITEKLSDLVNRLIAADAIVRTRTGWDVRPRRHTYTRAPDAGDDDRADAWPGDFWHDTRANAVYTCLSADRAAAVWVLLGIKQ